MSGLPSGWAACALSDIGHIVTGKTPSTKEPRFYGGDIPFIKPGDLDYSSPIFSTETYLTVEGAEEVPSLPSQSIVVTCIGNLGKVGLTTTISATNQQINAVIPHEGINPAFIFHYCKTLKPWLEAESSATTISIVNKGIFSTAPMSLPPFAEQTRIAQKLDELLAQVDTLKARIDAIPALLKRFRQSVLAAAVSGRLTDEWRAQNIPPEPETVQNQLNLHLGWSLKTLPELGELARGKSKHRPRNDKRLFGSQYPFIQTGEVANSKGRIKSANIFYSAFGLEQSRLFPKGTLCITIAANIADTAILDIDACFPDSVVGFIPKNKSSEVLFIKYLIDVNKQNLEAFAPATAQKNINLKLLSELTLPTPPFAEQTEIVRRVEQLFAFADQLEAKVTSAKSRIDHLTQSILAKAFRGELVPQDPNDEPASVLLERIKTQRAAAPKAKRGRKTAV